MEIIDLLGNEIRIGDKVAVCAAWTNSSAYMQYGEVSTILHTPKTSKAIIKIMKDGLYGEIREDRSIGKPERFIAYQVPRNHIGILKIG